MSSVVSLASILLPSAAAPAGGESVGGIIGNVVNTVMSALGAPGVALLVAAENLFPPIPSEAILPLGGFSAAQGVLNLWAVLIWSVVGSLVGAVILYGLGRWLGHDRFIRLFSKIPLLSVDDLQRTTDWFNRHGRIAVLVGRLIPIFRSLISIPAGIERMPLVVFIPFTLLGSAVWNTVLVLGGYLLGANWHVIEQSVGVLQYVVVAVLIAAVLWWCFSRIRRRRAERG